MKKYIIYSSALFLTMASLNLYAIFPGYVYADIKFILANIRSGTYNDWHSPFYTLMLKGLTKILPGPEMINVVNISMLWGGLWATSVLLYKKLGFRSLLFVLVPFFPGVLNLSGTVVIDQTLCGFLMLVGVLMLGATRCRTRTCKNVMFCTIVLICTFSFLTRSNAIFAILVLLGYAISILIKKNKAFIFVTCLGCMLGSNVVVNKILHVQKFHMGRSITIKHLGQLSYYEQKNLFPINLDSENTARILHECYRPEAWDNESWWGYCSFVYNKTKKNHLVKMWLLSVGRYPLDFFVSLLPTYKIALTAPLHQTMMYNWYMPDVLLDWEDQQPYNLITHSIFTNWVETYYNLYLDRPYLSVFIDIISIIIIMASREVISRQDRVFIGIMVSSLIYMLTYFIANVSTEYRYYLWVQIGADIGLLYTLLTTRLSKSCISARGMPKWLKLTLSCSMALSITAIFFELPKEYREIQIFPKGKVEVTHINMVFPSKEDLPYHSIYDSLGNIDKEFDGKITQGNWRKVGGGYQTSEINSPFQIITNLPYLDIAVGYKTGSEYGSFKLCSDGHCRIVYCHDGKREANANVIVPSAGKAVGTIFTLCWVLGFIFIFLLYYLFLIEKMLFFFSSRFRLRT